jgi:hypothetical protein
MAISNLSGSSAITGSKDSAAWDGNTSFGNFYPLQTVVVGLGGSYQIKFDNIPQIYTHLQIRCHTQTNRGTYGVDDMFWKFNNDSAANYTYHQMWSAGVGVNAQSVISGTAQGQVVSFQIGGTTTGGFSWGSAVADIYEYTSTNKYKVLKAVGGASHAGQTIGGVGNGAAAFSGGCWLSTAPITSISYGSSNLMLPGTHVALYGVK